MKIHITNLYNYNSGDELVAKQHRFADAGRELGFTEMGIFSYPVETDTPSELNKRLDGIIAALEFEDVVFLQLPSRNGYEYEELLFNKIKAYRAKIVLLLHNISMLDASNKELNAKYISMFKRADVIIMPSATTTSSLKTIGITNILFYDKLFTSDMTLSIASKDLLNKTKSNNFINLYLNDFYLKKLLMDAIELIFINNANPMHSVCSVDNEIQIALGLHDKTGNYCVWVGVTMQSVIEHTDAKICFHILHDQTLSSENRSKLIKIAASNGHRIVFHYLDDSCFSEVIKSVERFTVGSMFRLIIPEILPELPKIIYLDADLLVNRDIKELWNINISNYYLAAVPDMEVANGTFQPTPVQKGKILAPYYFNSGVLLLNLNLIRQKGNMKQEVVDYLVKTQEFDFPDQNALNIIYKDKVLLLDEDWNYLSIIVRKKKESSVYPRIYHYAGEKYYLRSLSIYEMDYLCFETLRHTPWADTEYQKLLKTFLSRNADRLGLIQKAFPLAVSKRKRIFYGKETYAMRNLYNLITIREGDYRILETPDNSQDCLLPCKKLSSITKESKDAYIIFVLPEADNGNSINNLEKMGLQNEINFFVVPRLLPPEQGGYV